MESVLRNRFVAAGAVALGAFALYSSTLLPGFDLGDTASFQVMAGSPSITPRDGYPLYFAIGRLFAALWPQDPAYALNVASAVEGAIACGLVLLIAYELSRSLLAATAAAAAFAGSYTFWSQSVIAEVYALHICLVAGTLLALLRWERRPTPLRLAWFFALFAFSFGNHLSMILLLPAYGVFLLGTAPGGWRMLLTQRTVGLASAAALMGALQYMWNVQALWSMPQPPSNLSEALGAFWFDATKSDWRDTMVLDVPASMGLARLRMYAFDLEQQFGWAFPALALAGAFRLLRVNRARAALLLAVFSINVVFVLGYNVGDSHVFFLPAHVVVAVLIAPGIASFGQLRGAGPAVAGLALVLAATRVYQEYPALDRSEDTRPVRALEALSAGLTDQNALWLTDMNWQLQNGLTYYARKTRPELAFARMPDVLLYAPALVRDNVAIDRDVVLGERAREELAAAYGPLFSAVRDPRVPAPAFSEALRGVPAGTRYVLCVLKPSRDAQIDQEDLSRGVSLLTGGRISTLPGHDYLAVVGSVGNQPAEIISSNRPFRTTVRLDEVPLTVRMESWLEFDTIRRMGFGHVIARRRHTLIVERGISFVAFDEAGYAIRTVYAANIFAPESRYLLAR
jgi:hypothetical protein